MDNNYNLGVDTSDLSKTIRVDLQRSNRDAINIGAEWVVEIKPNKKLFNFFGSKKSINTTLKVEVRDLKISPLLDINPNKILLSIIRQGEPYTMATGVSTNAPLSLNVTSTTEAFTLLFHPDAIQDINEEQGSANASQSYPIRFCLVLTDDKGKEIIKCKIRLNIEIEHVITRPRVELKIESDKRDLTYKTSLGIEKLGTIYISNDSKLKYQPRVDVNFKLSVTDDNGNHRDLPIIIDYEKASMPKRIEKGINNYNFVIKELKAGREVAVPIMIDYTRIGNPVKEPNGELAASLRAEVDYNNSNERNAQESLHVNPCKFRLRKNTQQPLLNILVRDPRSNSVYDVSPDGEGENYSVRLEMSKMSFLPAQAMEFPIEIKMSNPATENRNAGVYINAPQYSVKFSKGTIVKFRNPAIDNIDNLFTLQNAGDEELMNGASATKKWTLLFHSGRVSEIYKPGEGERDYNVKAIVKIGFDYYLDDMGVAVIDDRNSLTNPKHMELIFVVPLYRQPNPTWLAIDFGTSAIVAKHGNRSLDLHKEKTKLDNSEDVYEKDTPFLSSNLVLRSVGRDKLAGRSQLLGQKDSVTDFNQLALHLSPTSTSEKSNIQYVIPCLKLIVGYDLLPNLNNYVNYEYNFTDDHIGETVRKGLTETITTDEGESFTAPTPLAKVDTIFKEVYAELFKYYMSPIIKEQARSINQLVLTIPNTYSPLHLQRINEIVRSALQDINVRNIRFVSESDAVACYYQNNWTAINKSLGRDKDNFLKYQENVLVFDMGAGTLDITLFSKKAQQNGTITIEVLGKIGIAKAGNYLDSLIAELLTKHFPEMKPFSDPEMINTSDRVKAAIELKNFIKNSIKPRLSDPDPKYNFEERREIGIRDPKEKGAPKRLGTQSLDKLILEQDEFKQYIHEVTTEFLNNFFKFFRKENTRIDTVLISGRSAKLKPLQSALTQAIEKYGYEKTKFIDVSDLTEIGSSFDKAKTIVVEGAEIFAQLFADPEASVKFRSPNIVAAYGVLYRDIHGQECYTELLNPLDTPSYKSVIIEGNEIKLYKTEEKVIDLSSTTILRLIQTFSAQTQKDWLSGNHEYITVMREINVSGISGRSHTRLSIEVDEKNQMIFLVNGMQLSGISSSQIDINSRSNKRSLWPVLNQH